ncbi:hypothetical protein ABDK00_007880 [Niabella insulamsoli]|uniref:hypothetical protein n=1 Tax=Niabella insulamsoli TaxID=3144874 RepID=UPI0031FC3405
MKFLIYLFTLYMFLMPVAGWAGVSSCSDEVAAGVACADDEPEGDEDCSPLCDCSCCFHLVVNEFSLQKLSNTENIFNRQSFPFYRNRLLPADCRGNIWQPPK